MTTFSRRSQVGDRYVNGDNKRFRNASSSEETRAVFAHAQAQSRFGASVFWVTRSTSRTNIDSLLIAWQTTRDQMRRGIVEVIV